MRSAPVPAGADREEGEIWVLGLLAVVSGAATGLIVSCFRLVLDLVTGYRGRLLVDAHRIGFAGAPLVIAGLAIAAGFAAWLVRRFSHYASGSGVPEVEATLSGSLPPAPLRRIVLIKFIGGLFSIGSGLAVGPEGPGVQMGAVGARLLGTAFRRGAGDLRAMIAAGAGAGIAVAFNAPIAGAIFVLEELIRKFDKRTAIAGLGATASAILISGFLLGSQPELIIPASRHLTGAIGTLPFAAPIYWPLYLVFGALLGATAVLYSRLILAALRASDHLRRIPAEVKAGIVGASVGIVGWFAPDLLGTGTSITQHLLSVGIATLPLIVTVVIRFFLGPLSYAARTPGGLFAPLLALGALLGLLFGALCRALFPGIAIDPAAFAVVGMAAFFAGVVRAPVTGIVLALEMTAAFSSLLPMLVAGFGAMLTTTLLKAPPIYDSLLQRLNEQLALTRSIPANAARTQSAPGQLPPTL